MHASSVHGRLKVHVVYLLQRFYSSCAVRAWSVNGGGGEHINIYLYIHICMYTELSVQYTEPSLHVDYKFILLLLFLVLFPIIVLSMCVDR